MAKWLSISLLAAVNGLTSFPRNNTSSACLALAAHNSSRFPESFVRPSEINACMATIAVNKSAAQDLINGVTEMLDIYSYEDYALQSNNPQLSLSIDLRSGLRHLNRTIDQYTSFPSFTRQVTNLLNSLYDGHTVLSADCSSRISYDTFLPLAYFRPNATAEPRVFVHEHYDQFLLDRKINETAQFDLQRSLAGLEVLQIDGVETHVYLNDLLYNQDIVYGNIDPQTRWNQLFVNLRGHPTPRLGYGVALTSLARSWVESDNLNLTVRLENGTAKDVSLPWLGLVDSDYHKLNQTIAYQDYYSQYVCMAGNSTELFKTADDSIATAARRQVGVSVPHKGAHKQQYLFDQEYNLVRNAPSPASDAVVVSRDRIAALNQSLPSSQTTPPGASSRLQLVASVDSGFSIYHFDNTSAAVLYLTNFSSDENNNSTNKTNTFYRQFTREMTNGLKELKRRGVDTLLIDVSGNNGGATELGSFTMLSLFPRQYPGFATVLRSNAEMLSFLDGSDEQVGFGRPDGTTFVSLQDWISKDNLTIAVNGYQSSYSQLTIDNLIDNSSWSMIGNATFPTRNLFSPEKMMIISNGKCASTCAQVTMYLQDVHGVRSAGFGGKASTSHQLQTVGGVRGAQVVEMLDDDPAANMYNFTMRVSQLTINFRTAIHYQKRIPTEYVTRNVDYSYQHTRDTYTSFENTWSFIAEKHFKQAMSTKPRPANITEWMPMLEYPAGWFDGLLALQSSLQTPAGQDFPRIVA